MKVVFLLSKAPYGRHQDGDTQVSRLLLEAAAQSFDVAGIALADAPTAPGPIQITEVPKPPLRLLPTVLQSARLGRSMIHTRFAPPALVREIETLDAHLLVARRLYMTQAVLDSGASIGDENLVAFADVLESDVLRRRRSPARPFFQLESRRTWRDEVRCARAASRVVALSESERTALAAVLPVPPDPINLVLPALDRPADLGDPVALFIGDMHWAPNREAAAYVERLWPSIQADAPKARLVMVGRGTDALKGADGIDRLGFVEDIDSVWAGASVLLAPIPIGGGVRVKILDAARRGVPVVANRPAVGSTDSYLPVTACQDDSGFVRQASQLLADRVSRKRAGAELYESNRELTRRGYVEGQLEILLRPSSSRRGPLHRSAVDETPAGPSVGQSF